MTFQEVLLRLTSSVINVRPVFQQLLRRTHPQSASTCGRVERLSAMSRKVDPKCPPWMSESVECLEVKRKDALDENWKWQRHEWIDDSGGDEVAEESLPPPGDSSCGHGSGRREGDDVLVREEVRTSDTSGRCGPQLQELANLHGRGDAV